MKPKVLSDEQIIEKADEACDKAEKEGKCHTGDSCMDCRERELAVAAYYEPLIGQKTDEVIALKWQLQQAKAEVAREIISHIQAFRHKPRLYHYRCWGSSAALVRDEWGEEPTYQCRSYDGDFNCGCRKCPWGIGLICGELELQDFERHQNEIIEEVVRSFQSKYTGGKK